MAESLVDRARNYLASRAAKPGETIQRGLEEAFAIPETKEVAKRNLIKARGIDAMTGVQQSPFSGISDEELEKRQTEKLTGVGMGALTFAGVGAKTADIVKLRLAQKMEDLGKNAKEVWNSTGWFRGADDKWRFEIPDIGAKRVGAAEGIPAQSGTMKMSELIEHPELYKAYPELADLPVKLDILAAKSGGSFHPEKGIGLKSPGGKEIRSAALHELQHAIQMREKFARGGSFHGEVQKLMNQGFTADIAEKTAFQRYMKQAGEVEARTVQGRLEMSPEALKQKIPTESYDVPIAQQAITFR